VAPLQGDQDNEPVNTSAACRRQTPQGARRESKSFRRHRRSRRRRARRTAPPPSTCPLIRAGYAVRMIADRNAKGGPARTRSRRARQGVKAQARSHQTRRGRSASRQGAGAFAAGREARAGVTPLSDSARGLSVRSTRIQTVFVTTASGGDDSTGKAQWGRKTVASLSSDRSRPW